MPDPPVISTNSENKISPVKVPVTKTDINIKSHSSPSGEELKEMSIPKSVSAPETKKKDSSAVVQKDISNTS